MSDFVTSWTIAHQAPLSIEILHTGVGCHALLLQRIFPNQGSNHHQGSPWILQWLAYSFSMESSRPRNQTSVSCIAGRLFTDWAMREALWELSKYDTEKQASAVGKRVPIDSLNSGLPENFICKNRNAVSEMHNNVKKHPKMKGVSAIREHSVNESVA